MAEYLSLSSAARRIPPRIASHVSPVSFANIETLIPDIHAVPRKLLRNVPRPRVIKSHEYFDLRYKRLIYIVRDPRDVAVSYFHFHRKFERIPQDYSIEVYIP